MTDLTSVEGRLRALNPVRALPGAVPPADALARIVATPRPEAARRRSSVRIRRPLLALCIALLLACGIALAADFTVRYFDDAGTKALPPSVSRALEFAATHRSPTDRLLLDDTVTAYAFTSPKQKGTVYMTPYAKLPGFCAALEVTGKPVQAGCVSTAGAIADVAGGFGQPWDVRLAPDMHALLGRLAPTAAGDEVRIAFEDGTTDDVPMRGRWFAYAVAGERTRAGHRPVQLSILHDDRVIRRRALAPTAFNTLAAARALVPASDGSRGQDAVRRFLLDGLTSLMPDGGAMASHTDIAGTKLVAALGFGDGRRVSIYAAPVGRMHGWRNDGSILVGLDDGGRRILSFSGVEFARDESFGPSFSSLGVLPGHPGSEYDLLVGRVPSGTSSVQVRTADGREHRATFFLGGRQWIWLGHHTATRRPVVLVGRDASGAVVTTRRLHGRGGVGG
jgi:hypothetical protein